MNDVDARDSAAQLLCEDVRRFSPRGSLLVNQVLARFFPLVYDLPASERHHHSWSFGLVDHCLEVALATLFKISPAARRNAKVADLIAPTIVIALLHDLGKLFNVVIEETGASRRWDPLVEPLSSFRRRPARLRWHPGRGHAIHSGQKTLIHMFTPAEWRFPVLTLSTVYESRFQRYQVQEQPPFDYLANVIAQADGKSAWHGRLQHPQRGMYLRQLLSRAEAA